MVTKNVIGIGSYNYRGDWNWLDQIITSDISMSNIKVKSVGAYQKEFMMYTNKKVRFIQVDLLEVIIGMEVF